MNPTEFERLMNLNFEDKNSDLEEKHISADILMCDVLRQLGYEKGVEIFEKAEKWYA